MSSRTSVSAAAFSIGLGALLLLPLPASASVFETEDAIVHAEILARGLENPWALAFLPDGAAIVTERPGRMRILSGGRLSAPLSGVPRVAASGQGGLLDIAIAPDFEQSNRVYFTFSEPSQGGAGTAVARATLVRDGDGGRLENVEAIFSMSIKSSARQHFGSRLAFHPDGTLFVTTGDRGKADRAQDMNDHAGAVLRINPYGTIPADNPSPDGSAHLPEIWSKGHRNIQGAVYDPITGALWTTEHGARGGDELNRPQAGLNYGWPVISYGRHYTGGRIGIGTRAEGYEQPVMYWDPSIAPSGLAVYEGDMFPAWRGDFLSGALAYQLVARIKRDDAGAVIGEERMFERQFGRIRDVRVAPDGSVWLVTDEANGAVIRLSAGG